MDRHAGDQQQVAVQCDQTGNDGVAFLHQHTARDRERAVQPCRADHAAVAFGIQPGVFLAHVDLGVFLDTECRRIRVGSCNVEAVVFQMLSHAERNDAGPVAADEIAFSGFKIPLPAFQQLRKSFFQQDIPDGCCGVVWYAVGLPSIKDSNSRTSFFMWVLLFIAFRKSRSKSEDLTGLFKCF